MFNPITPATPATAAATSTAEAGSPSSKAGREQLDAMFQQMKTWRLVGTHIANDDNQVVAKIADNGSSPLDWEHSPADLALRAKAKAILAIPAMVEALQMVLFGLTEDADNNNGEVDKAGVLGWVRNALAAAGLAP